MTASRARASAKVRSKRGFTLVELMVAISAGMLVAMGAFLLAKVALSSFHEDARANAAQYSGMVGMNRLLADIKRAGYMSTPELENDAKRCGIDPGAPFNELLVGLHVYDGTSGDYNGVAAYGVADNPALPGPVTTENGRAPDRVRVSGNFATNEIFEYRHVNEGTNEVHLAIDKNAFQRVFKESLAGGPQFCDLFQAGRFLRLLDGSGRDTYAEITACVVNGAPMPTGAVITYAPLAGSLPRSGVCGAGIGAGYVNPVTVVEYSLQHFDGPAMGNFVTQVQAAGLDASVASIVQYDTTLALSTGDGSRMDLVRRELDTGGNIIPGSGEIAAEYVVDFKVRLRYQDPADPPNVVDILDSGLDNKPAIGPRFIRGAGVRLSTRARTPERTGLAPAAAPAAGTPLNMFYVFGATANEDRLAYARVRTLYAEAHLQNLANH